MPISPLAGKPAPKESLVDLNRLEREYHEHRPDLGNRNELVDHDGRDPNGRMRWRVW
jgi:phosphoglucomutase